MTEILTAITAVMVFLTAAVALTNTIIAKHTRKKVEDTAVDVAEVHTLVNSRMTDMGNEVIELKERILQLTTALNASDTDVPPARDS